MPGHVHLEGLGTHPGFGTLTLDHAAKRNALDVAMWRRLHSLLNSPEVRDLRVLILRGAHGHFAAGGDIEEFPRFRFTAASLRAFHEDVVAPALTALRECPAVIVAQIEGSCIGGGLEIALACDLRLAAPGSRFGAPVTRLGFAMAPDEMHGLVAMVGHASASELLLEGRLYDAAEAWSRGLIHRVVAAETLAEEAIATAQRIACGAPGATRQTKRMLARLRVDASPFDEQERATFAAYAPSSEHREGIHAFLGARAVRGPLTPT